MPAREEPIETRVREALLDLCFERGFSQVEIEDLLERAELDRARFERRYVNLETCFHEVYDGERVRFRAEAATAQSQAKDWRGRVRATAYALYRFLAADERVRWFTAVELPLAPERTRLLAAGEFEALVDLIDEGRNEPGAPSDLSRATAESVAGGIFSQIYATAGRKGPMPAEAEIVPPLMHAVVLPYLGTEAAAEELEIGSPGDEQRLRDALTDLCFERGYAGLRISDVCERAGLGRDAFDAAYTDLEACLCAAYLEARRRLMAAVKAARAGEETWRERLRATAYAMVRFFRANQRLTYLGAVEIRTGGERAHRAWEEGVAEMLDLIDEGREEGAEVTRETAAMIGGGINSQLSAAVATRQPIPPPEEIVPELMYTAVLPYLGSEEASKELLFRSPATAQTRSDGG